MKNNIPWIEKYRPKKTDDLIVDNVTKKKIDKFIEDRNMQNIIITGTPGIGKTTTIRCIAKALYGKYVNEAVIDLNASDERGIKSVHEIINFCKKKLYISNEDKDKYATHKLIILDEADSIMEKAQNLISTIMEKYHKTTRFAFTCNNSSDIIESIQSRCIIMRYMRLSNEQIIPRLEHICNIENVKYEKQALNTIATIAQGDMRTAINNLQLVYNANGKVDENNIYSICDKPQPDSINEIFKACLDKDLGKAIKGIRRLKDNGFIELDIILNMIFIIRIGKSILTEKQKHIFMSEISQTAYIISKGNDGKLQISACLANIIKKCVHKV